MQNGSYLVRLRGVNTMFKLTSFKGRLKLYDVTNGHFVKPVDENVLASHYEVIRMLKSEKQLYNIEWYVNGKCIEQIICKATWPVVKWRIDQLSTTSHTSGKLIPVIHQQ